MRGTSCVEVAGGLVNGWALAVSIVAVLVSSGAVWYARRTADAATSAASTQRETLALQRAEIDRRDTPRFDLAATGSGDRVRPTNIEVRLASGPNLASVVARLDRSVDTRIVHGVARAQGEPPRDAAEIGPVTLARNGHIWVTIPERHAVTLALHLVCTEDAPEGRQWTVPVAYEISRDAQLLADAEDERRR